MSAHRILVTGGAGYIGSHSCKMLAANGFMPVVYDNLSTGHRDAVRWGPFVEGDILDTGSLASAIAKFHPVAVIHFAASAYVGESVADPAKYYRNNVAGTISLLDACRQASFSNLVFSSSCATYGAPAQLPIKESTAQEPISPYGRSKLMAEQILRDHGTAYGLRYVVLRYFNACGADPDGEIGERHDPETHLIPRALLAAAGKLPHLKIFGDDYLTSDGTCVRDYIHVTDLAHAHVLALRHLFNGGENLIANLGTGRGTSVGEILQAIQNVTARSVPTVVEPRRSGDAPALFADPTLARDQLGFRTELSDIDTIVKTAAQFFGMNEPEQHVRQANV